MIRLMSHIGNRSRSIVLPSALLLIVVLCMAAMIGLPHSVRADEPSYRPEEVLSFARSLFDKNEYQLALLEYRRFLFSFPGNPREAEARMGEADCLFWTGDYDGAQQRYLQMARDFSFSEKGWEATLKAARTYQQIGQTSVAEEIYARIADQSEWPGISEQARFDLGWAHLYRAQWDGAALAFKRVPPDGTYGEAAKILSREAPLGSSLARKDPMAAGILSGILPGAGQLYCGQPKDAVLAFALNGMFIFGTIEAFNKDLYVVSGILLLIESAWYGGSIYNAVNHAHKFNRKQEDSFIRKLWDESSVHLVLPEKEREWYQLMLTFPF